MNTANERDLLQHSPTAHTHVENQKTSSPQRNERTAQLVLSPKASGYGPTESDASSVMTGQRQQGAATQLANAFDVLGDRRKRRKVSVEPGNPVEDQENPQPSAQANPAQPVQPPANETTCLPARALVTPERKREYPPKFDSAEAESQGVEENATEPKDPRSLPGTQRTSRKKRIQLDPQESTGKTRRSPRHAAAASSGQKNRLLTLKNGKFSQTLVVVLRYKPGSSAASLVGSKIDEILSKPASSQTSHPDPRVKPQQGDAKSTHPFFLGKPKQVSASTQSNNGQTPGAEGNDEAEVKVKKPVDWKDIVFKSNKPAYTKEVRLQKPPWPPRAFQHIGIDARCSNPTGAERSAHKQKWRAAMDQVPSDEDVLQSFSRQIQHPGPVLSHVETPHRLRTTAQDALDTILRLQPSDLQTPALVKARNTALSQPSPFDRAEAPGPLPWAQKYAPTRWEEVLQSSSHALFEWLGGLAVHHVKQGLDPTRARQKPKRKKLHKRESGLDDFIVDDSDEEPSKIKNAILLVGPSGCGKTASVYAVANQLGFEVFEIHSGMRRSQKDIFDKVGDMAQNHMVQAGAALSSDSSVLTADGDTVPGEEDLAQPSVAAFFAGNKRQKAPNLSRPATPQPSKEQKQSLILLEEVDQVFEDDRGFWSGVQALIEHSKRPVVLTCNTLQNIPMDELDLYATLHYTAPPSDVAIEYLVLLAAAEGHLIEPEAVQTLYHTTGNDLRSTMMELDFWCQMTVGSQKGGLDWFPDLANNTTQSEHKLRTFSRNTYREGLDLVPTSFNGSQSYMAFLDQCLHLPVDDIIDSATPRSATIAMPDLVDQLELLSAANIFDQSTRPTVLGSIRKDINRNLTRKMVCKAKVEHISTNRGAHDMFECLRPLEDERPVFPPAQGRLAPSLDSPLATLACEIAPYVRCIAAVDYRLEQARCELQSSQSRKSRSTRAARAAAEGSDKANTRPERWLPLALNLADVLKTGNDWPQWWEQEESAGVAVDA